VEEAARGNFDGFILKEEHSPDEIMPHLFRTGDPVAFKLVIGKMPEVKPELKADLYGVCGSPGTAEGRAIVVKDEKELVNVRQGDILVAPFTASRWSPDFRFN